jgi:PKD repeat protein
MRSPQSIFLQVLIAVFFLSCEVKVPPKPVASFTVANNNCTVPCEVTFANNSQHADSYLWDFGDGSTSTEASPKKSLTAAGQYQVKLIARGEGGSSGASQLVRTVAPAPPVAAFSISNNGCIAPCTVSFTNQSTNATSFLWTFGDNTSSTLSSPTKQYSAAGTYEVRLTVSGPGGSSNMQQTVTINSVAATVPVKVWDKTLGGNLFDEAASIIATADGGYLVAGTSSSGVSGDMSEGSKGGKDYWVVKINANGSKVWDRTFGGSGNDELQVAISTSEGGFLLVGFSDSNVSGDKTENSKGGLDFWIVKINASGAKVWDKTYGGSTEDRALSVVATPEGGFVVAGWSESNMSGDKTQNGFGNRDFWVIKITGDGSKAWDKAYGGSEADMATSITSTADGNFVIGGFSYSPISGEKSEPARGESDFWVVKIDSNGRKVWDKTFGGSRGDFIHSIISVPDGGIIMTGDSYSNASDTKSENSWGGTCDFWVVKVNNNGVKVWDKTLGGGSNDLSRNLLSTPDGGVVISGFSDSSTYEDKTEDSRGEWDFWIVKLSSDGRKVWDKTYGGDRQDVTGAIVASPVGGFIIAGGSVSNISGDKSENSRGGSDFWIIKIK